MVTVGYLNLLSVLAPFTLRQEVGKLKGTIDEWLYQLNDYYCAKDLEGIFHFPVKEEQIKDDRFGYFLDVFYDAGCRTIFFRDLCQNFANLWDTD